jgi:hypothetical protein
VTLNKAIEILMRSASNDVIGMGCGMRSTTEEWRNKVSVAWAVAFRRVARREPDASDYFNYGMTPPAAKENKP